jgi:hypothetical protein
MQRNIVACIQENKRISITKFNQLTLMKEKIGVYAENQILRE